MWKSASLGASLTEMLTALAVAAVLVGVGAPGMSALVGRGQADAAMAQMVGAIRYARHLAITRGATATLCPGVGNGCGRRDSWHEGALIFLDNNGNGRLDGGEEIARRLPPLPRGHRLRWRSFRNRKSLSLQPNGLTNWQNGNMLLCPPDKDAKKARQIIINAQARVRLAQDGDGDGVVEGGDGRPVSC